MSEKKNESNGLKQFKEKKHLVKPILVVTFLIIFQIVFLIYLYRVFSQYETAIDNLRFIFTFTMIIYFINIDRPIDYRVAWIIVISLMPFAGILLYILLDRLPGPKKLLRRLKNIKIKNAHLLNKFDEVNKEILENENINYGLEKYLYEKQNYPIYKNTKVKYFSSGEAYFESLLKDLEKAENCILMEFFIVRAGKMMNKILSILSKKSQNGVDVKLMYDGTNEYYLPHGYKEYLESLGIEVMVFSAVKPILSTYHNNRDHRKIVSIDNKIGYTGGLNLADEYINLTKKYGHWKDNGLKIEGDAVRTLTIMYFYLWNLNTKDEINIEKYIENSVSVESNCYVQPFDDSPNDEENVGENVIVDILLHAKKYVYIMTPYLVPTVKIINALKFASKKGVDIKILIPGIPDKKIPYMIARSYYPLLIDNNIEIYEYIPGFLHSKSLVSDDKIAVVGSINLDYRSLHLNYENAILVYCENLSKDIKNDFKKTIEISRKMDRKEYDKINIVYKLAGKIAKLLAPLM